MKKLPLLLTSAVVGFAVLCAVSFMSIDSDELDGFMTAFQQSSDSISKPMETSVSYRDVEPKKSTNLGGVGEEPYNPQIPGVDPNDPIDPNDPNDPNSGGGGNTVAPSDGSFLAIVQATKANWAAIIGRYSLGGRTDYTHSDGNTYRVRIDCSGFVGFCLFQKGLYSNPENINSSSYGSPPAGVTAFDLTDPSQLEVGDILFYDRHVQVLGESPSGSMSDKPKVYNWGSPDSALVSGLTGTDRALSTVKKVWRVN